jgi:hypothetical protein
LFLRKSLLADRRCLVAIETMGHTMKTLLLIAFFGVAASAMPAQEFSPAIADVAKASRTHTIKPAKVLTNDDISSRATELPPAPNAAGNLANTEAKDTSAPAQNADQSVPCPADLLRDLLDQQGSAIYGIEVLKATIALEKNSKRLRSEQALLENKTESLAALQRQIEAARNGLANPPANCGVQPARNSSGASGKQPVTPPVPIAESTKK